MAHSTILKLPEPKPTFARKHKPKATTESEYATIAHEVRHRKGGEKEGDSLLKSQKADKYAHPEGPIGIRTQPL